MPFLVLRLLLLAIYAMLVDLLCPVEWLVVVLDMREGEAYNEGERSYSSAVCDD
jgi:hypothetical protein